MHPKIFLKALEEQLRRIKLQHLEVSGSEQFYDLSPDELLGNAKTWFLRTLQNTDLTFDDMNISAVEYLEDESMTRAKIPPYSLLYPSVLWMISQLDREQIEAIFGMNFFNRLMKIVSAADMNGLGRESATSNGGM